MNNFLKIFYLVIFAFVITNCSKTEDPPAAVPLKDFADQYSTDIANIKKFLQTHSITVDSNFNVTDYPIVQTADIANSIWGANDAVHKSTLLERIVTYNEKQYLIYYLKLNQGTGDFPCSVDEIQVSYSGRVLGDLPANSSVTPPLPVRQPIPFDARNNKVLSLYNLIRGWSEIFPQFNGATATNPSDCGAGIMFLPSGFAYFNIAQPNIDSYSPLIFSFKLHSVIRSDQDGDGIFSIDENSGSDRYISTTYDSDGDGKLNFLDQDDDNDNVLTAFEIKRPKVIVNGVLVENGSYPFSGAAADDLLTPFINETKGVPACGDIDFTSPTRIRKYLDASCK